MGIVFTEDNRALVSSLSLGGTVDVPSSKSAAHRELIAAALSSGPSVLRCNCISQDILATADCLNALGADIRISGEIISVSPISDPPKAATLPCRESGTTLRFMIPIAAFLGVDSTVVCASSLAKRPISDLCDELKKNGVEFPGGYTFPLRMKGKASATEWSIRGDVSSQFISGLLLAFPLSGKKCTLTVTGSVESRPYIDMTCNTVRRHGIAVKNDGSVYTVGCERYLPLGSAETPYTVEADWSGAGFWFAAGLSSERGITLVGLDTESSQGDKAIYDILHKAGANITLSDKGITIKKSKMSAFECDCRQTPDMVPILSVCAAYALGTSKIHGIERLRLKESDRIESTRALLSSLKVASEYENGVLTVHGGEMRGGSVDGYNDHRIVMSAAVASCFCSEEIAITDAHAVKKSYPAFWDHLASLIQK